MSHTGIARPSGLRQGPSTSSATSTPERQACDLPCRHGTGGSLAPDALIMSDPASSPGARSLLICRYLSVQANTVRWSSRRVLSSRIIGVPGSSLEGLANPPALPGHGLEVAVHGAHRYSGRCLLSGLLQPPGSEPGHLHQLPCRWDCPRFGENPAGDAPSGENASAPTDAHRGRREHGTYIMNSGICGAIGHASSDWWRSASIPLKIEGRPASPYAARTCQTYRQAIDDAPAGRPLDPRLLPNWKASPTGLYRRLLSAPPRRRGDPELPKGHSESDRSLYVAPSPGTPTTAA